MKALHNYFSPTFSILLPHLAYRPLETVSGSEEVCSRCLSRRNKQSAQHFFCQSVGHDRPIEEQTAVYRVDGGGKSPALDSSMEASRSQRKNSEARKAK